MATNIKISELPAKTTVTEATDLVIVQDGNTTNVMTVANLLQNKIDSTYVSAVGHSGEWADILNKPNVVTTSTQDLTYYPLRSEVQGWLLEKAEETDLEDLTSTVALKPFKTEVYLKGDTTNVTLASYGIADAYTKTEVYSKDEVYDKTTCLSTFAEKAEVNAKADKSTSLAGYGILDAYTKTECTDSFATKSALATTDTNVQNNTNNISALITTVAGKFNTPADKTIAGFGITNAYTKTEVDDKISGAISGVFHYKGTKPTKADLPLTGNTQGDVWNVLDTEHNYAWSSTSATGTLSDWDDLGGTVDLSAYLKKTDTLYGADLLSALAAKADKTDTYTISDVNTKLSYKADKATTLEDYGITNAYNKTAVDNMITPLNTALAKKFEADMVVTGMSGAVEGAVLKVVNESGVLKLKFVTA